MWVTFFWHLYRISIKTTTQSLWSLSNSDKCLVRRQGPYIYEHKHPDVTTIVTKNPCRKKQDFTFRSYTKIDEKGMNIIK